MNLCLLLNRNTHLPQSWCLLSVIVVRLNFVQMCFYHVDALVNFYWSGPVWTMICNLRCPLVDLLSLNLFVINVIQSEYLRNCLQRWYTRQIWGSHSNVAECVWVFQGIIVPTSSGCKLAACSWRWRHYSPHKLQEWPAEWHNVTS